MLDIELGFQCRFDIDIGEYAEAFFFQGLGNLHDGGIEWYP